VTLPQLIIKSRFIANGTAMQCALLRVRGSRHHYHYPLILQRFDMTYEWYLLRLMKKEQSNNAANITIELHPWTKVPWISLSPME